MFFLISGEQCSYKNIIGAIDLITIFVVLITREALA